MIRTVDAWILNGIFQKTVDRHRIDPQRAMRSSYRFYAMGACGAAIMQIAHLLTKGTADTTTIVVQTMMAVVVLVQAWIVSVYIQRPSIRARMPEGGYNNRVFAVLPAVSTTGFGLAGILEGRTSIITTLLIFAFGLSMWINVGTMYLHACSGAPADQDEGMEDAVLNPA